VLPLLEPPKLLDPDELPPHEDPELKPLGALIVGDE